MIHVTCPGCLATVGAVPGSTSRCPTCGTVFTAPGQATPPVATRPSAPPVASRPAPSRSSVPPAPSRPVPVDEKPAPKSRRRAREVEDDDDDEDRDYERPKSRTSQAKRRAQSGDAMVPMLILGGLFAVLLLIGGIGFGVYYFTSNAVAKVTQPPAQMNDPFVMNNPGMNDPFGGMPPNFDPFAGMPPPGANFQPQPLVPPAPQPPKVQPGAGIGGMNAPTVTLSNARKVRGIGLSQEIEVEYQYPAGQLRGPMDVIILRNNGQNSTIDIVGIPNNSGSVRIRSFGGRGFVGPVEIWMERRTVPGPFGTGTKISNTLNVP
jgi:hypothetical protein